MAARKSLDLRPGPMPDITAEGTSVTFRLTILRAAEGGHLTIRCDDNGQVWVSIPEDGPSR